MFVEYCDDGGGEVMLSNHPTCKLSAFLLFVTLSDPGYWLLVPTTYFLYLNFEKLYSLQYIIGWHCTMLDETTDSPIFWRSLAR